MQDMIEAGVLAPPAGQLCFEAYVSEPLDSIVYLFGEGMRLLKKGYFVGGVSANGLRLNNGDGVQVIEVDSGVAFEPSADNRIAGPLDFDEIGDPRNAVFPGDF